MINWKLHSAHKIKNKLESIADYCGVIIYSLHEPTNINRTLNLDTFLPIADYWLIEGLKSACHIHLLVPCLLLGTFLNRYVTLLSISSSAVIWRYKAPVKPWLFLLQAEHSLFIWEASDGSPFSKDLGPNLLAPVGSFSPISPQPLMKSRHTGLTVHFDWQVLVSSIPCSLTTEEIWTPLFKGQIQMLSFPGRFLVPPGRINFLFSVFP